MSTQSFTGYNPKYNPNQNPKFAVTYNVPDKKAPPDTVNKIFLRTAGGKYFDIKRMIAQERSSLNLHDIQNKSILHYILMNQNLSKNEKYELILQVLEMGAPVDTSDTNGVRPLHLASGQQNRKLVNLLLEKGAEINSQDNNFMTPLHYAVTPETIPCKPINERKLIPENNQNISTNQRSDDLFNALFTNFQKDQTVRMYIAHMAHIFKFRFPYDSNDMAEDSNDLKILINESLNQGDVKTAFNEKLIGFNKTVHSKTLGKLSKSITKVHIKENTKDGWGPEINGIREQKNNILPFKNLTYIQSDFRKELAKRTETLFKEFDQTIENINKKINDHDVTLKKMSEVIDIIFTYHAFVRAFYATTNSRGNPGFVNKVHVVVLNQSFTNLLNQIVVDNAKIPSDFNSNSSQDQIVNHVENTVFDTNIPITFIGKKTLLNIVDNYLNDAKSMILKLKNIVADTKNQVTRNLTYHVPQIKIINNISDVQLLLVNVSYISSLLGHIHTTIITALKQFFFDFNKNDYATEYIEVDKALQQSFNIFDDPATPSNYHLMNYDSTGSPRPENFDARRNLLPINMNYKLTLRGATFNLFLKSLNDDESKMMFIVASNRMGFVGAGDYMYDKTSGSIRKVVHKINSGFYIDDDLELLNTFNSKIDKQKESIEQIYNAVLNTQEKTNTLIDIVNQINGYIFVFLFNNQMSEKSYDKTKTDLIDFLMMTQMKHINLLPNTYFNFYNTLYPMISTNNPYPSTNFLNTVKFLIDTYGFNISHTNRITTIETTSPSPVITNGLLTNIIKDTSSIVVAGRITLGTIENKKKVDVTTGAPIGFDYDKDKIDQKMSVVGSVLDYHVNLIKLILIMYFSQKIYGLVRLKDAKTPLDKMLLNRINHYLDDAKKISGRPEVTRKGDNIPSLLVMIAKMVDDTMISTIKNFAQISATNYVHYLTNQNLTSGLEEESDPDIKMTNLSQLIVRPNNISKNNINEIISASVDQASPHANPKVQYIINEDLSEKNFQNRLIDFDSMVSTNDMCFDIDEDIASLLLSKGADQNIVDRSGMTPLWFAVYLQNERIIGTLLKAGSRVIQGNKNIYESVYNQLIISIKGSPLMNISEINQRVDDHLKKKTSITRLFSNSHLILQITSYLFSHQLTTNASYYPNLWSRESQQKIISMIQSDQLLQQDLVPLAKVNPEIISENIKGFMVINQTIDSYKKQLTDERDVLIRIDHSIRDIKNEKNILSSNLIQNDFRIKEIDTMLNELLDQKSVITKNVKNIMNRIRSLIDGKNNVDNKNESDQIIDAMSKSNKIHSIVRAQKKNRYVCDIYETFFRKIINDGKQIIDSEYTTYINLWASLLSSPDHALKHDFTQMIPNLLHHIVDQGIQNPNVFIDSWEPVCDLYEKVLDKYGKDYLESSLFMNKNQTENYVLKQIYCIMVHVFTHIISVNYVATVTQLLAKQNTGETPDSVVNDIHMSLKTSGFFDYCMETMPQNVIKIVCKIFEHEKDPLIQGNVLDVLNKSIDFLSKSTSIGVNENKISMLKEQVVPFFVSYMEAYVAEMHALMIKQIKSFIVQNKWLRVIKMLAQSVGSDAKTLNL
jgi:ankyrin repeat protein